MAVKKISISLDSGVFWKPETAQEREVRLTALARLRGEVPCQQTHRAG